MSITTYAELKTAVKNWLRRGTEMDSYVDDLVTLGEKRIYRKLRVRAMEEALNSTIASGVIAVPSDYVSIKHAYVDGTPVQGLQRKSAEWIYSNYPTRSADGKPKFIARESTNFIFGPYPDSGYTVKGIYYKRLSALSSATNDIFTNHPDLYLFAALAETAIFIDDKRTELWVARFNDIFNQVQGEEDEEGASGGPLTMAVA